MADVTADGDKREEKKVILGGKFYMLVLAVNRFIILHRRNLLSFEV